MFEHFTFGAQVQPHHPEHDEVAACPRDMSSSALAVQRPESFPTAMDESPMNDLLCKLNHQSLEAEDSEIPIRWTENLMCSAAEKSYGEDHELSYISSRRGRTVLRSAPSMKSTSSRSKTGGPCKRQLRQINTQLQSCMTHVKDISTLVEDMISTNTQCNVSVTSTISAAPSTAPRVPSSPQVSPLQTYFPPNDLVPSPLQALPVTEVDDEGFSELSDSEALEVLMSQRQLSFSNYSRHNSIKPEDPHYPSTMEAGSRRFSVMRYGVHRSYSYQSTVGELVQVDDVNNYMPREPGTGMVLSRPRMRLRREDEEKRRLRKQRRREKQCSEKAAQEAIVAVTSNCE